LFGCCCSGGGGGDGEEEDDEEEERRKGAKAVPAEAAARALAALRGREPEYVDHVEAMLERARRDHWRVQLA
jgi:hypothetical protein